MKRESATRRTTNKTDPLAPIFESMNQCAEYAKQSAAYQKHEPEKSRLLITADWYRRLGNPANTHARAAFVQLIRRSPDLLVDQTPLIGITNTAGVDLSGAESRMHNLAKRLRVLAADIAMEPLSGGSRNLLDVVWSIENEISIRDKKPLNYRPNDDVAIPFASPWQIVRSHMPSGSGFLRLWAEFLNQYKVPEMVRTIGDDFSVKDSPNRLLPAMHKKKRGNDDLSMNIVRFCVYNANNFREHFGGPLYGTVAHLATAIFDIEVTSDKVKNMMPGNDRRATNAKRS